MAPEATLVVLGSAERLLPGDPASRPAALSHKLAACAAGSLSTLTHHVSPGFWRRASIRSW